VSLPIGVPTEEIEQAVFINWLKANKLYYWHTPNSTYTKSWSQKRHNQNMGVQSGIPDLFVIVGNRVVGVEMKRIKGGVISENQKVWIERLNNANIPTKVCKGALEAIEYIKEMQNVKPR
jgi:hypothetical protein